MKREVDHRFPRSHCAASSQQRMNPPWLSLVLKSILLKRAWFRMAPWPCRRHFLPPPPCTFTVPGGPRIAALAHPPGYCCSLLVRLCDRAATGSFGFSSIPCCAYTGKRAPDSLLQSFFRTGTVDRKMPSRQSLRWYKQLAEG